MRKKLPNTTNEGNAEQKGAFHRLFIKQQAKINAKPTTTRLLKTFAEEDYRHIAKLIQLWLNESPRK